MPLSKAQQGRAAERRVYRVVHDVVHDRTDPDLVKVFEDAGQVLLDKIKEDYLIKHWGGVDSTGARWEPTKGFYINGRMMIRTGDLFNSLTLEVTPKTIKIRAKDIPYAKYALGRRPAWPLQGALPENWLKIFQQEVINGLKRLIQRRLSSTRGAQVAGV